MARMFRAQVAIYLPMKPGETQEEAEDRMLELIEEQGMEAYEWENAEVINNGDGDGKC